MANTLQEIELLHARTACAAARLHSLETQLKIGSSHNKLRRWCIQLILPAPLKADIQTLQHELKAADAQLKRKLRDWIQSCAMISMFDDMTLLSEDIRLLTVITDTENQIRSIKRLTHTAKLCLQSITQLEQEFVDPPGFTRPKNQSPVLTIEQPLIAQQISYLRNFLSKLGERFSETHAMLNNPALPVIPNLVLIRPLGARYRIAEANQFTAALPVIRAQIEAHLVQYQAIARPLNIIHDEALEARKALCRQTEAKCRSKLPDHLATLQC